MCAWRGGEHQQHTLSSCKWCGHLYQSEFLPQTDFCPECKNFEAVFVCKRCKRKFAPSYASPEKPTYCCNCFRIWRDYEKTRRSRRDAMLKKVADHMTRYLNEQDVKKEAGAQQETLISKVEVSTVLPVKQPKKRKQIKNGVSRSSTSSDV